MSQVEETLIDEENQIVSDDNLKEGKFTFNWNYKDLGQKSKSRAIIILGCLLFCGILMLGVLLSLSVSLPICITDDDIDFGNHEDDLIVTTTEFQITLENLDGVEWEDRAAMMESWMDYFSHKSKYFDVDESTMTNQTRIQYYINIEKCNADHEIRVRNVIDGFEEGTQTIDIKGNSHFHSRASKFPFWPADRYQDIASQKCERDEHVCDHKYSRETRITLDYFKTFEYCIDIVEYFPYAFGSVSAPSLVNSEISGGDEDPWFLQSYSGYLDGDTLYKVSFTIKYDDVDGALNHKNPHSGEWSIRLYSLDDGASSEYNEDVYKDITDAWKSLISRYSTEEC